jgi:hypothetical protein
VIELRFSRVSGEAARDAVADAEKDDQDDDESKHFGHE